MIDRSRCARRAIPMCLLPLLLLVSVGALASSHVVQQGETLYSLAKRYGTTVQDLVSANSVGQDYVIRVGQVLSIPVSASPKPSVSKPSTTSPPAPAAQSGPSNQPAPSAPSGKTATVSAPQVDIDVPGFDASVAVGRPPAKPVAGTAKEPVTVPAREPAGETAKAPLTGVISLIAGELELLARLVMAEAGNEPIEGQVAVAAVVVNRVRHKAFPKTVTGVINEPGQFKSVELGRVAGLVPSVTALDAVQRAISGEDPSGGALFFYNPAKSTALEFWSTRPVTTTIGNHRFAK